MILLLCLWFALVFPLAFFVAAFVVAGSGEGDRGDD